MTDREREQACIKKTPPSAVTEQIQALWGEVDYLFQDGIVNSEIQKMADEVDELRTFIEACMESNEILHWRMPHIAQRREEPEQSAGRTQP